MFLTRALWVISWILSLFWSGEFLPGLFETVMISRSSSDSSFESFCLFDLICFVVLRLFDLLGFVLELAEFFVKFNCFRTFRIEVIGVLIRCITPYIIKVINYAKL